jgi:hypothetical protein
MFQCQALDNWRTPYDLALQEAMDAEIQNKRSSRDTRSDHPASRAPEVGVRIAVPNFADDFSDDDEPASGPLMAR